MAWLEVAVEIVDKGRELFLVVREFGFLYTVIVLACSFTPELLLILVMSRVSGHVGVNFVVATVGGLGGLWVGFTVADKIRDRRRRETPNEVYKRVKEHPEWLLEQACKLADSGRADLGRQLMEMGIENATVIGDEALAERLNALLVKYEHQNMS